MTNREILNAPKEALSSTDRQKQHVLQTELTPVPCPVCLTPLDALTAAGIDVDGYEFKAKKHAYRCPHCQAELEQVVPFIVAGPSWHWVIRHDWLVAMLSKAKAFDEQHSRKEAE